MSFPGRCAPRPPRVAGFTVLELLVTLALISLVMGVGVGVFLNLTPSSTLSAGNALVESLLRSARNFCRAHDTEAVVVADFDRHEVYALALRAVGQWHFEDAGTTGAFGRDGTIADSKIVEGGTVGKCLRPGKRGEVDCGVSVAFDPTEGIGLFADVRPERDEPGTIFAKGGGYWLSIDKDFHLHGGVGVSDSGRSEARSAVQAESGDIRLVPERWARVGLIYNGVDLRLYINAMEVARVQEGRKMCPDPEARLRISAAERPFPGLIDEATVYAVSGGDRRQLPKGVVLAEGDRMIRFDATGRLDPRFHLKPAVLVLKGQNRTARIEVGLYGTVR